MSRKCLDEDEAGADEDVGELISNFGSNGSKWLDPLNFIQIVFERSLCRKGCAKYPSLRIIITIILTLNISDNAITSINPAHSKLLHMRFSCNTGSPSSSSSSLSEIICICNLALIESGGYVPNLSNVL